MLNRHSPIHTESNSGVIESNPWEYPNVRWYKTQKTPIANIANQPIFAGRESYHCEISYPFSEAAILRPSLY
jgi:hypothetical protein